MTARRDEAIDRLLHETRSAGTPPGECPDAETLAAFAEGTLRAPARRDVEAHIADCHRCQMVTASMVNVESTLGAWPDEAPAKTPWWRTKATSWIVPAAVGVTAGALWLAVVDQRRPPSAPVADGQSEPARELAATPAPESAQELRDAVGSARGGSTATLPSPQGAMPTAKAEERQERAAAAPLEEPATIARDVGVEQGAPAAPAPAPAETADLLRQTTRARANEADQAPARAQAPAAAPPLAGAASVRGIGAQRRDAASFDIVSSDPQVRWRIVAGAAVQRSDDGGASWATQQTGVTAELTAGSAPGPDVCWIVGRDGVVMRTTNAGRLWERVKFPVPVDLTAVTASSPLDAAATLVDGRRFRTTDGGATWAQVP